MNAVLLCLLIQSRKLIQLQKLRFYLAYHKKSAQDNAQNVEALFGYPLSGYLR